MFETELKKSLESSPSLKRRGKKILAIIDSKPSARRTRILAHMERHAAAYLAVDAVGFDWASVNWAKIVEDLLKILLAILPLLLL